jgi:hypothetical protein
MPCCANPLARSCLNWWPLSEERTYPSPVIGLPDPLVAQPDQGEGLKELAMAAIVALYALVASSAAMYGLAGVATGEDPTPYVALIPPFGLAIRGLSVAAAAHVPAGGAASPPGAYDGTVEELAAG